jgi:hypothetical protein
LIILASPFFLFFSWFCLVLTAFFILRRDEQLACKGCEEQAAIGILAPPLAAVALGKAVGRRACPEAKIPIIYLARF